MVSIGIEIINASVDYVCERTQNVIGQVCNAIKIPGISGKTLYFFQFENRR